MNTQNTKNTLRMTLVALTALSATMLAGVTHAVEFGDALPMQPVTYKDLDLNSNAGIEMLYKRIEGAANQVCGKADARDLRGMSFKKACVERAISNAVATVNNPTLTRVSLEKSDSHVQQSFPIAQVR
jgi:UrcA family protein